MSEPMTLVERLRNPKWVSHLPEAAGPWLHLTRTVDDMRAAADEIEALQSAVRTLGRQASWERERVAAHPQPAITISDKPLPVAGQGAFWPGTHEPPATDPRKEVLAELLTAMPVWTGGIEMPHFDRYALGPTELTVIRTALRDAGYLPPLEAKA